MGVIIKIRDKFGYVMIILIALAIVSFLLMDSLSSNSGMFSGNTTEVGEINGESIEIMDFEKKVQQSIENYRMSTQATNIDDQTMVMIRQQTWEQYIKEALFKQEFERLGLTVTADELLELMQGSNPHPAVKQAFTNPETGVFDPSGVVNFIQNMDNDPSGQNRSRWLSFEKFVKEDQLNKKYSNHNYI
jgi:peptidyl-prolyl cis-trans isomerase D